jgi:hypothetical protein
MSKPTCVHIRSRFVLGVTTGSTGLAEVCEASTFASSIFGSLYRLVKKHGIEGAEGEG